MGLVRFALILLIIFFLIRIFTRYILRSYFNNLQKNYDNQKNQYQQKKEGEVTVEDLPKKGKIIDKNEGDYIDYEDVKE